MERNEPIAIIGMACRFPGGIKSSDDFWETLLKKECKISHPPFGRWENMRNVLKESPYLKKAGFLEEDIYGFDYKTFRLTPKEVSKMDPQQRIVLKVSWEAFENAGYAPDTLSESLTGVFMGISVQDYNNKLFLERQQCSDPDPLDIVGSSFSFLTGRISYYFGLQGPSIAVDTACSSSLVAVNQGCRVLQNHECNMALAGGVNILYDPETSYILSKLNILSPECLVKTFDDKADGTVRGEGCGVVVLKRLSDAQRDGDVIHAVVMGGSINQDGPSSGITAPYGPAQEKLLRSAWTDSGVNDAEVGYIETHGTGTKLGDPIEVAAISNVLVAKREKPVYLGAVKTNIGHLEAAAGVAGLIKAIYAVREGIIPANLNYDQPSKFIDLNSKKIAIADTNITWEKGERTAGISAFGLSGTNAHIVIRNHPTYVSNRTMNKDVSRVMIKFSANGYKGIQHQLSSFVEFLSSTDVSLEDIAYRQNISKADFPTRLCIFGVTKDEVCKKLNTLIKEVTCNDVVWGNKRKKLVFMFTGQGSQYIGMGKSLYIYNDIFKKIMNQCNYTYKEQTGEDLLKIIFEGEQDLNRTIYTQPALFAIEYAVAKMWMEYGVEPDILLGHSIGEYVAGCVAEVFSLQDAFRLVIARGISMEKSPDGKMLAIHSGKEQVAQSIQKYKSISIAATNKGDQTVVSGLADEIECLYAEFLAKGIRISILQVKKAFHSSLMGEAICEFEEVAKKVLFNNPQKKIISNVTGSYLGKELTNYEYWCRHILSEVKFLDSIEGLGNLEEYLFSELGPSPILTTFVESISKNSAKCIHLCLKNNEENIRRNIYSNIADYYVNGQKIKWKKIYTNHNYGYVHIPNFVFEESEFEKRNTVFQPSLEVKESIKIYSEKDIINYVRQKLTEEMGIDNSIKNEDNLLEWGINSIMVSRLISLITSDFEIELSSSTFIQECTIHKWAKHIRHAQDVGEKKEIPNNKIVFESYPEEKFKGFSLNEVQNAYFLGRSDDMYLGGVSCYASFEIDIHELNIEKFKQALEQLVYRHDMLRCVINNEGIQHIEEKIEIPIEIYQKQDIEDLSLHLENIRDHISHKVLPVGGVLFQVILSEMENNRWRIHFAIDFMIADALSIFIIMKDLNKFYHENKLNSLTISFKDYLHNVTKISHKQECKKYWEEKITEFPEAPQLPIKTSTKKYGKFVRKKYLISAKEWGKFEKNAGKRGLTSSAALLALYSEILSAWGGGSKFAIMLTLFNRKKIHSEINEMVGDFTNLALLEVNRKQVEYVENAYSLQNQMQKDLEFSDFSGIEFLKLLRQRRGADLLYPVVFTSALGMDHLIQTEKNVFLENLDGIVSSTPQVLLDHQVYDEHDGVALSWDYRKDLFYPGVIENMFQAYVDMVVSAIKDSSFWDQKASDLRLSSQIALHNRVNSTYVDMDKQLLYKEFFDHCEKYPEKVAVIYDLKRFTYRDLQIKTSQISSLLLSKGIKRGDKIVMQMKKSFDQVAVVIGILQLGCVYIPFMYNQLYTRTKEILDGAGAKAIFLDNSIKEGDWGDVIQLSAEMGKDFIPYKQGYEVDPDELAYIIYTSGSTGEPKGVCITHDAAVNTIADINKKFEICTDDCVLALSAISFDLSVYDIFGLLSAGGTIVVPTEEERTDPHAWYELISRYEVTVWNSVPALMSLLVEYISSNRKENTILRKIFLSGDWIPLSLPEKMKKWFTRADTISLGGATEASIWSIYYPVKMIEKDWNSIPYGYPLQNQGFYVLDEFGRNCPVWVEGKLYIHGRGLSKGYFGKPEITEKSYPYFESCEQQLYDTGDYGRYMNTGAIEFLGRKDSQVKINGYRIETGEIVSAFRKCEVNSDIYISVIGKAMETKKLVAYIVKNGEFSVEELEDRLHKILPEYYVPAKIISVQEIPINNNGKVDHKELEKIYNATMKIDSSKHRGSENQNLVLNVMEEVLNIKGIDLTDNFSRLGVSSVDMIRLANVLERRFGKRPAVGEMMSYKTIGDFLAFFGVDIKRIVLSDYSGSSQLVDLTVVDNPHAFLKEDINKILTICRQNQIKVYLDGDNLRYIAPKGIVNTELLKQLKEHKSELIEYLEFCRDGKFPLTPIQWAYVMGRSTNCELGNTSAHYYAELTWKNLDTKQLERAINIVIATHDILRATIFLEGKQIVHSGVPNYKLKVHNVENYTQWISDRQKRSHHTFELGEWPMFSIQVYNFVNHIQIVTFEFDCIIMDGWSSEVMLNNIYEAYVGKEIIKPRTSLKECILSEEKWMKSHADSEKQWIEQMKNLPAAPTLLLSKHLIDVRKPIFARKQEILSEDESERLTNNANKMGVTPSAVVCTAYMKILSKWSENKNITLNLTLFNRLPIHEDMDKVLGDFTNITLVPYFQKGNTFEEEIQETQRYLWESVEHRNYDGLKLLKELSRESPGQAIMPIIFTSMLYGETKESNIFEVIDEVYAISQTPQVVLDHQIFIRNNKTYIIWDYVNELFSKECIGGMFNEYILLLRKIIKETDWNTTF